MEFRAETIDEIDNEKERESLRKIEAALFIAGKYLSVKELVSLTDVNPILLKRLLEDLVEKYKDSGIQIVKRDDLWKMDVAEEHVGMVNKLATGSSEFSRAEQETLAIIAYKQPMKQSVLIKIRGNKAYDHVANFVKLGLVNKKRVGHTSELSLNDNFYDYFALERRGEGESVELDAKADTDLLQKGESEENLNENG
jgi:segregation and condensation protein B